jgi:diguanylate cyclase (GGDEF)-like protein
VHSGVPGAGYRAPDGLLQLRVFRLSVLQDFFRTTDICCRYVGEEFAIILPESTSRDAATRADALRSEVKNLRLQYKKQALGSLTVSVGVAAFPEHGSTSEELLKIADQCLYESKARGRDVVTVAPPQNG